jgi:quinol monooxygenase YgiN
MHGLINKMTAVEGKRDELIAMLLQGTKEMPGCLSYIVAKDPGSSKGQSCRAELSATRRCCVDNSPVRKNT